MEANILDTRTEVCSQEYIVRLDNQSKLMPSQHLEAAFENLQNDRECSSRSALPCLEATLLKFVQVSELCDLFNASRRALTYQISTSLTRVLGS